MNAILVSKNGGPEVLVPSEATRPEAGPADLLVRVSAAGVNFIDVYQRTGLYPIKLPFIPGSELSGVVEAVGAEATGFSVGDRVAIAHGAPVGAYAEYAAIPAQRAVPVPAGVTDKVACAVMLQGMTAHYLAHNIRPLQTGMTCLVHAAAGGVGLLLCQIAKQLGARVIGTVSTDEKAQLARDAGADEIILYTREEVVPAVKRITQNRGVDVAFDSVGKTTFESSLLSLVPRGMLVSFGQSSGPVPPLDPLTLSRNGSLFLTRPTLAHYVTTREELLQRANDLFAWIARGKLRVRVGAEYPLAAAADAHRALESRATTGKVLLLPSA
ncbi:MAG: quinone oxidoreductase [Gemmatimonadota bacterium]